MNRLLLAVLAAASLTALVQGHGYLITPPQRNSAWRAGFNTPEDSNDMAGFCGGAQTQHGPKNQGRCGVCGEEYSDPNKRLEPGPANKYATGLITANYQQGETIDVSVVLTAFHKGYYEFRLCENDVPQKGRDASIAVTQQCFDQTLLKSPSGETKFTAVPGQSTHKVVLDSDVYCTNCVLQWRYRSGNNWACEGEGDKKVCGTGVGPQEEFWGCSDVAIAPWSKPTIAPKTEAPTTEAPTTEAPMTEAPTTEAPTTEAPTTEAPATEAQTTEAPTTEAQTTEAPATEAPTTEAPTTEVPTTEVPTTEFSTTEVPTTEVPTTEEPTTEAPTTEAPKTAAPTRPKPITRAPTNPPKPMRPKPQNNGRKSCKGTGIYVGFQYDIYCNQNCNHITPYCPPSVCTCR